MSASIKCPHCHYFATVVADSRPVDDNTICRRRRCCRKCGFRFTTHEVHAHDLIPFAEINAAGKLYGNLSAQGRRVLLSLAESLQDEHGLDKRQAAE